MKITVLVTLMVFLAYFLVLYGGVGFIQDKRFFSSAPKENLDAIPDTKERFPGAHSIGWVIEIMRVIKKVLHEKRKTTEAHIQQLQHKGKQGIRYTAMMPDARFARRLRGEKQ